MKYVIGKKSSTDAARGCGWATNLPTFGGGWGFTIARQYATRFGSRRAAKKVIDAEYAKHRPDMLIVEVPR